MYAKAQTVKGYFCYLIPSHIFLIPSFFSVKKKFNSQLIKRINHNFSFYILTVEKFNKIFWQRKLLF